MPDQGGGISGLAVASATAGGLLLYAALTGQSPTQALKSVLSGHPGSIPNIVPNTVSGNLGSGGAYGSGPNGWLAQTALTQVGVPYRWGGNSPSGFDCSGLVQWSFAQHGISCPRTTYTQYAWKQLYRITKADLSAGDLVYWTGHVVIAIDNTNCVAAEHTGTNVMTLPIANAGPKGLPILGYMRYTPTTPPIHTQN